MLYYACHLYYVFVILLDGIKYKADYLILLVCETARQGMGMKIANL